MSETPGEFRNWMRAAVDKSPRTLDQIARSLQVSRETLIRWLKPVTSSRHIEPHHLMQVGAKEVMRALERSDSMGQSPRPMWEVTEPGAGPRIVGGIIEYCAETFGEKAGSAYQRLKAAGRYRGYTARKINHVKK